MDNFYDFNISKQLLNAIVDLGFEKPTPIQAESYSVILSGQNMVGIAQTGTGKTLAYMLPILNELKYSEEINPKVLVIVPTRELVVQVVNQTELFAKYKTVRVKGVYGGANINTQKKAMQEGMDILVATPGRLYDLVLSRSLSLKSIKKLVIDEVDVMLDLGFRFQLTNIFELLPNRRQNIMFSATMNEEVDLLIKDFFVNPAQISIAVSGTPLNNIAQQCYEVPNFYTKANLLSYLLKDETLYKKVIVFAPSKKIADKLYEELMPYFGAEMGVIHSNKSQNARLQLIEDFNTGAHRILIATDVIARGIDLDSITHVINFDTPIFPENYMHRIGRTGRATQEGNSILLYSKKEKEAKARIEALMQYEIPKMEFPDEVEISRELIDEEKPADKQVSKHHHSLSDEAGPAFHEKSQKNKKVNLGGSYRREIAKKYKKPKTRGDKGASKRR